MKINPSKEPVWPYKAQPLNEDRRSFLKLAGAGLASSLVPERLWARDASHSETVSPNVILIFSDDQGSVDLHCYGSEDLETPHLDALARRGVRFDQFYVAAPICSPSRASLLTGRYPQRVGLDTNASQGRGMAPQETTLAEMFRDQGYHTALFGKWHLGTAPEMSPLRQGFDEFFGHKEGCIDNYSHYFYWNGPNRHDLWRNDEEVWENGKFFPDLVVREALRFMESHREDPFFLYLPFNVPHYPLQGLPEHLDRYRNLEEPRRSYAAFVSTLDEKIGEVLAGLKALDLKRETIVIFMSDNGHSVEERTFGGGGNAGLFRGHKFTLWEGGIRVPCIASWPGHWPEGEKRSQVVSSMDWVPTLAEICHLSLPEGGVDGKDIRDVLSSSQAVSPHADELHWQQGDHWAVRSGPWKLVCRGPATSDAGKTAPKEDMFLSNMDEDPSEEENQAGAHADIVARLTSLHEAWARETSR